MSNIKRFVSGGLLGGALLAFSSFLPAQDTALVAGDWTVSCDGNYCCTVNQSNGDVGKCWNK
jgi:roadblock/LC7 domain-containing protein